MTEPVEGRDWSAPFGELVPRPYRECPREALTAQAYFHIFWFRRAGLVMLAVGSALMVIGIGVFAAAVLWLPGLLGAGTGTTVVGVTVAACALALWPAIGRTPPVDYLTLYTFPEDEACRPRTSSSSRFWWPGRG